MSKVLMLHGPRDLRYEERTLAAPGPTEVRVRSRLGAISAGTEAAWYFGTDPQLDPAFRAGRVGAAVFPKTLGYEKVAEVVDAGADVTSVRVGDRVICRSGHEEERILPEGEVIAVPEDVSDEDAVACSLAMVAMHAIRRSRLQLGDDVFVAGQGFLGLLIVMISRLAGAGGLVVSDTYEVRRQLALHLGADDALDPMSRDLSDVFIERYGQGGFDVAFETSSSYDALRDAMASLRRGGRLCVVSQLKGEHSRHPALGAEFHLGELELISADGRGDQRKLSRWYFEAIRRGALPAISALVTHRIPFTEVERGFKLLESEPENVVKILVTYE